MIAVIALAFLVSCVSAGNIVVSKQGIRHDSRLGQGTVNQADNFNNGYLSNAVNRQGYIVGAPFDAQRVLRRQASQGLLYNGAAVSRRGYIYGSPLVSNTLETRRLVNDNNYITRVNLNQAPFLNAATNVITRRGYIAGAPVVGNAYDGQSYLQNKKEAIYGYYRTSPWARTEVSSVRRTIQAPRVDYLVVPNKVQYSALHKIGQQFSNYATIARPGIAFTVVKPPFSSPYAFYSGEAIGNAAQGTNVYSPLTTGVRKLNVGHLSAAPLQYANVATDNQAVVTVLK